MADPHPLNLHVDAPGPRSGQPLIPPDGCLSRLVQGASRGDRQAFAELFDRTRGSVFSLAFHVLRDWQLAEEITIDVFVEIWRSVQRIQAERADVMSWLMTLTRHRSIDRRRARDRRRSLEALPLTELQGGPGPSSDEPARETAPDARPLRDESDDRLREALAALPAGQRAAIELAYFPGLSQAQIAQRLGEPLGTIKSRIRLGMKKMKEKLVRVEEDR